MRVRADLDLCQGHAMCEVEAPAVFELDRETDQVHVLQPEPEESQRDAVACAVKYCPAMALSVTD